MKGIRLANGKSALGKGRLTDVTINRIQNYFGQCNRNNKYNLQGVQNYVWAIFKHMIQDDSISMAEQHANCPKCNRCKYWSNNLNYDPSKKQPRVFVDTLKPIFTRLTNEDILQRCIDVLVYRKPTHTGQYLYYSSHHQTSCKERVVSSLFNKAYSIIIKKDDLNKENARIKQVLKENGCQERIINKIFRRITNSHSLPQPQQLTQATDIQ